VNSGPDPDCEKGQAPIRARALATRVQVALERLYKLDRTANVGEFLFDADAGEREAVARGVN